MSWQAGRTSDRGSIAPVAGEPPSQCKEISR